jgi:methionyl aminopeptidase
MKATIKSEEQINIMKEGGEINARALAKVVSSAAPGVSLEELDKIGEKVILQSGGEPAFKRVPGYHHATCLNVNEGVVHGIPSSYCLREGDLLSVDLGTLYKGLNTDAAWTLLVGKGGALAEGPEEKVRFLETGRKSLQKAIAQCQVGKHIGDISAAIEKSLRQAGYAPSESLVGHGVGESLHEDPPIPCLASRQKGPKMVEGMTLAIEVIYSAGSPDLVVSSDGWTLVTVDGSLSGLFEHTVALTTSGPIVLTDWMGSGNI